MPGSVKHGKQQIKEWIATKDDIHHIIDIGAGSATYPKLLGPSYTYEGVEIFEDYIERFNLNRHYKNIIISDVFDLAYDDRLPDGDCIIFGDVLEHLEKNKGWLVLRKGLDTYKHVILSIPLGYYPAAEHYGNKHELHLSTWEFDELKNYTQWEVAKKIKDIGIFMK